MNYTIFTEILKALKKTDLEGFVAQSKMSPPYRAELIRKMSSNKTPRKAAVLILFYPKGDDIYFSLMKRAEDLGPHSKQICLPGGEFEQKDVDYWNTSIRETEEELGVSRMNIKKTIALTSLYIPPSNYDVYPYIGYCDTAPEFKPNRTEVSEVLEVKLEDLLAEKTVKEYIVPNGKKVPSFVLNNSFVWGATAMILSECKEILKKKLNLSVEKINRL